MGILTHTCNLSQYNTTTDLPSDFLNTVADKVRHYSFRDIDDDSTEERSIGWVAFDNILDNTFESISFLREPFIVLGLRVDKRNIPAATVKRYCLERENEIKKDEEIEFLPKRRIKEIEESVKLCLLKKAIPSTQVYDMVWDFVNGQIFFTNTSAKMCDEFLELFHKTFEISPNLNDLSYIGGELLKEKDFPKGIVESFKYLDLAGAAFLTWLWHESLGNGASFNGNDVFFDEKVVLCNEDLESKEVVTCVGNSQGMQEIATALENNKRIIQAKLGMITDSGEWSFIIDSLYLDIKSLRTPKIQIPAKEDLDGYFYEKIYLFQEIVKILNEIYKLFVVSYGKKLKKGGETK